MNRVHNEALTIEHHTLHFLYSVYVLPLARFLLSLGVPELVEHAAGILAAHLALNDHVKVLFSLYPGNVCLLVLDFQVQDTASERDFVLVCVIKAPN